MAVAAAAAAEQARVALIDVAAEHARVMAELNANTAAANVIAREVAAQTAAANAIAREQADLLREQNRLFQATLALRVALKPVQPSEVPQSLIVPADASLTAGNFMRPSVRLRAIIRIIVKAERSAVDQLASLPSFFPNHLERLAVAMVGFTTVGDFEDWFLKAFQRHDLEHLQSNMMAENQQTEPCAAHITKTESLFVSCETPEAVQHVALYDSLHKEMKEQVYLRIIQPYQLANPGNPDAGGWRPPYFVLRNLLLTDPVCKAFNPPPPKAIRIATVVVPRGASEEARRAAIRASIVTWAQVKGTGNRLPKLSSEQRTALTGSCFKCRQDVPSAHFSSDCPFTAEINNHFETLNA